MNLVCTTLRVADLHVSCMNIDMQQVHYCEDHEAGSGCWVHESLVNDLQASKIVR
jgi:hypothetical protein